MMLSRVAAPVQSIVRSLRGSDFPVWTSVVTVEPAGTIVRTAVEDAAKAVVVALSLFG